MNVHYNPLYRVASQSPGLLGAGLDARTQPTSEVQQEIYAAFSVGDQPVGTWCVIGSAFDDARLGLNGMVPQVSSYVLYVLFDPMGAR